MLTTGISGGAHGEIAWGGAWAGGLLGPLPCHCPGVCLCLCCFPSENPGLVFSFISLEWDTTYVGLQGPRRHTQLSLINWLEGPILFILPLSCINYTFFPSSEMFIQGSVCWTCLRLAHGNQISPTPVQRLHIGILQWDTEKTFLPWDFANAKIGDFFFFLQKQPDYYHMICANYASFY